MPIELWLAIVVIVVLLAIWVWMNMKWMRHQAGEASKKQPLAKDQDQFAVAKEPPKEEPTIDEHQSRQPIPEVAGDTAAVEQDETLPVNEDTVDDEAASAREDEVTLESPVEVVPLDQATGSRVFSRPVHPFRLNVAKVPLFEEERWLKCFYRLTEDDGVLGWMAFHEEIVGASDREYESKFIEALNAYKRTLESLRREVGISEIVETSIVGDEGKMWFLSAIDDVWLALFVDRQADMEQLSKRLLSSGDRSEA